MPNNPALEASAEALFAATYADSTMTGTWESLDDEAKRYYGRRARAAIAAWVGKLTDEQWDHIIGQGYAAYFAHGKEMEYAYPVYRRALAETLEADDG